LAIPGTFSLTPHDQMRTDLGRDYEAMAGMIFGPIPAIDTVIAAIAELEQRLNQPDEATLNGISDVTAPPAQE
jgi:hypothetical protein